MVSDTIIRFLSNWRKGIEIAKKKKKSIINRIRWTPLLGIDVIESHDENEKYAPPKNLILLFSSVSDP